MFGFNSISANAISSIGVTASQNAVAKIAVGPAFSRGFDFGYAKGPLLVGTATITQEVLHTSLYFNAKGTVEKVGLASLPVVVSTNFNWAMTTFLKSQLSFSPNSVLLLGGTASIVASAQVAGSLTSPVDNADTVDLILYLDKQIDLASYIRRVPEIALYLDKQKTVELYIDEIVSKSQYIDKQVSFDLKREK
jgi:hypothetical protein